MESNFKNSGQVMTINLKVFDYKEKTMIVYFRKIFICVLYFILFKVLSFIRQCQVDFALFLLCNDSFYDKIIEIRHSNVHKQFIQLVLAMELFF